MGRPLDEPDTDLDALLEELRIDIAPPQEKPYIAAMKWCIGDVGRYYAEYRSTLSEHEAVIESCRRVFIPEEFESYMEYLDWARGQAESLQADLAEASLKQLVEMCEHYREMICTIQPRELASREPLHIVDLAEVWAVDLWAWVPPAGEPSEYWAIFAATSILNKALTARTPTGKLIKLDQALFVIGRVQSHHLEAQDMDAYTSCAQLVDLLEAAAKK
jgi:hypothetical protein